LGLASYEYKLEGTVLMSFPKFVTLPLAGCGGLGQQVPDNSTFAFAGGSSEPFVVQVSGFE
jgi:hypothetical protein